MRWSATSRATCSPRARICLSRSSASAPELARMTRKRSPKPRRRSRATAARTAGSSSTATMTGRRSDAARSGELGAAAWVGVVAIAATNVSVLDALAAASSPDPPKISDQLEGWLTSDGDKTLGSLIELFEEKSFAILFVLLLGVSALPIPTGGATHVFIVIAVIVAAQLVVGRDHFWIPKRWRGASVGGGRQERFIKALLRLLRFLERFSRPRLAFVFDHALTNAVFGLVVIVLTAGAFFAPP